MSQAPLISIIIPVFNAVKSLGRALDSVLSQSFCEWEAICVDDGSTDGSGSILDVYAEKSHKISKHSTKSLVDAMLKA